MENQRLIPVGQRLRTWALKRSFHADFFRGILIGILIAVSMLDVTLYYLLDDSIKYGELPPYILDVAVVSLGLLEAVACLLWAWLGRRVRAILILCTIAPALAALLLIGAPNISAVDRTELCTGAGSSSLLFEGITLAAAGRLAIVIIVAIISVVSRAAVWALSVPVLDRGSPQDISLHFGIILSVRVIALRTAPKVIAHDQAVWIKTLGITLPLIVNTLQLTKFEEPTPKDDHINANWSSLKRVLLSSEATAQMLSIAFLASALWGFVWHETDIKKTRYLTTDLTGMIANQAEGNMLFAVLLAAVCYGIFYSHASSFNRVSAMKLATFASFLLIVLYCVQTMVFGCSHGEVAGLDLRAWNYSRPECSAQCGCAMPWSSFAPVCSVDSMTTYLSACHAGCVGSDSVQGLTFLHDCTCSPSTGLQRMALGACGELSCAGVLFTHRVFTVFIISLTVLCIQVQVVCVLRAVRQRDRISAFALALALLIALTFAGGHMAYFGIQAWTCAWFEAGRCHLQSRVFAYAVGALSAALGLLAFLINVVIWRKTCRRRYKKQNHVETDLPLENYA